MSRPRDSHRRLSTAVDQSVESLPLCAHRPLTEPALEPRTRKWLVGLRFIGRGEQKVRHYYLVSGVTGVGQAVREGRRRAVRERDALSRRGTVVDADWLEVQIVRLDRLRRPYLDTALART